MAADGRVGAADPLYYLKNFQLMLDTLQRRDGDLLAADEWEFINGFAGLPTRARALLVRMVMRKGPLFRGSRLCYPEIADLADAVSPLVTMQWVDESPRLSLVELFQVLNKAALVDHLGLPRHMRHTPKAALLAQLRDALPAERTFAEWCAALSDRVYRLRIGRVCRRLTLMFFGNFRQGLAEFVLADMGIFKYEKIDLQAQSRPFRTRDQVDAFHQLHECRELLHQGASPAVVVQALPAAICDCEWLQERREKLRFQLACHYERAGAVTEASQIYSNCHYPEARVRALRLHDRVAGVARRRPQPAASRPPEFVLTLPRPAADEPVERVVLDHLVAMEPEITQVHYVENGLINSLFGLLCWQAIFAPIPGAFFHPFHHAPADLGSAGFFERRQSEFAACLGQLKSGVYKETMRRHWVEKAGIASPFVAWGLLDAILLETALTCIPAQHLQCWFDWIARDVKANRTGFPDLVQFWSRPGRYRLIEVKGPGDRLQDNQRRCLAHCLQHGMPVSVCHVRWSDAEQSAPRYADSRDIISATEEAPRGRSMAMKRETSVKKTAKKKAAAAKAAAPFDSIAAIAPENPKLSAVSVDDDPEVRRSRIATEAYYQAERRGFVAGSEEEDWIAAEAVVRARNSTHMG